MKLFFLPYAGGSANTFLKWKRNLRRTVQMVPIELAGRGRRFHESFYSSWDEALDDLSRELAHTKDGEPYMLFGHSMGGLLAYELCHRLGEIGNPLPSTLFLSGIKPPSPVSTVKSHLPHDQFVKELTKLGGISKELLQQPELLDTFLPIVRADFRLIESYRYQRGRRTLDCPAMILNGREDHLTSVSEMEEWSQYFTNPVEIQHFQGGHFFIQDHGDEICRLLNKKVNSLTIFP